MFRIELKEWLALRHRLPAGFEYFAHLNALPEFCHHVSRRRVGQTLGRPYPFDFLANDCLNALGQRMFFGFLVIFVVVGHRLAGQAHITSQPNNKGHALVFGERTHQPFIDAIEHHQHFHPFVLKNL